MCACFIVAEVAFTEFLNEAWDRKEASIQTQTADAERPRCNTPVGLGRQRPFASTVRAQPTQAPAVHKRAVFDDMDIKSGSSASSSFRSPPRPLSMNFDSMPKSSLDLTGDSALDTEFVVVPQTFIAPMTTPGRTSPRPHGRKTSAPSMSTSSKAETAGGTAPAKSSMRSLVSRGLGTLGRSRKSTSPSTASVTSESGSELEGTEVELASPSVETFYAEPHDAVKGKRGSLQKQKLSASSSLTLPSRGSRTGNKMSSSSSISSLGLDEYATPADARISLSSQARSSLGSVGRTSAADDYANPWDVSSDTRSSTASLPRFSRNSGGRPPDDYANPWDANAESTRLTLSSDDNREYVMPADFKRADKVPPSPLLAPSAATNTASGDEYALPADVVKMKKKSPNSMRKPKAPTGKSVTLGRGTRPPSEGASSGGIVYAFPHEVLKPKVSNEGRRSSEPLLSDSMPNLSKPPTDTQGKKLSAPTASNKPVASPRSRKWLPKPFTKPKPLTLPRESSLTKEPTISAETKASPSSAKDAKNIKDAFSALSKEMNPRDSVAPPSPATKPKRLPKPQGVSGNRPRVDLRWSRPESVQIGMTDVQAQFRAAEEEDGSGRSQRSSLRAVDSGSANSLRSASPRTLHPPAERRPSGANSLASSSCGSDSMLSSDDDLPSVSGSQLQRNTTGIRYPSGEEDLSITEEVSRTIV